MSTWPVTGSVSLPCTRFTHSWNRRTARVVPPPYTPSTPLASIAPTSLSICCMKRIDSGSEFASTLISWLPSGTSGSSSTGSSSSGGSVGAGVGASVGAGVGVPRGFMPWSTQYCR